MTTCKFPQHKLLTSYCYGCRCDKCKLARRTSSLTWRTNNPDSHREWRKANPKQWAYADQKNSAKKRGITWAFTFETWKKVWEDSGHWDQRGGGTGDYCMARFNDTGDYSPGNVKIITIRENMQEMHALHIAACVAA